MYGWSNRTPTEADLMVLLYYIIYITLGGHTKSLVAISTGYLSNLIRFLQISLGASSLYNID